MTAQPGDAYDAYQKQLEDALAELKALRAELKPKLGREAELSEFLKSALSVGFSVPGAKLAEAKPRTKWAPGAFASARELSPELVREDLVPVSSVEPELLDRCKELGLVKTEEPAPRLIISK